MCVGGMGYVSVLGAHGVRVHFESLSSKYGHDAFLIESKVRSRLIWYFYAVTTTNHIIYHRTSTRNRCEYVAVAVAVTVTLTVTVTVTVFCNVMSVACI